MVSVPEFIQEWCIWIIRSVSLKLTERVVAKGGQKGKWACRINRKQRCMFKLSPITRHQPFLNNERLTFLEFSSANLQSKRWRGGGGVSWKDGIFVSVALALSAHLVWGFMFREAEWTKLRINTFIAKLAFVSEGSLLGDLAQQNTNMILKL